MMKSFLLGMISGATMVWCLKDSIATRIDAGTRTIRAGAAHSLRAAADAIEAGFAGAPPAGMPTRVTRVS